MGLAQGPDSQQTERRRGLIVGLLVGACAVTVLLWAAGLLSPADRGSTQGDRQAIEAAAALQSAFRNGGTGTLGTRPSQRSGGKDEGNPAISKTFNYDEALATGGAYDAERCGDWHLKYRELHRRILSGDAPQRYMVAQGMLGLADGIVGLVTVFYLALFSNRAFQALPHQPHFTRFNYEWLYGQPHINWTATEADDPEQVKFQFNPADRLDWTWRDRLDCDNWQTVLSEKRTIGIETNLGFSAGLFKNPHYRQLLFDLGLRPETAFGCAYDFLFYPHRLLFEEHAAEFERLRTPEHLKIGIQVRTGDDKYTEKPSLDKYLPFFDCATQIEREYAQDGQQVLWYLITDNAQLRELVQDAYGDKIVVSDPNVTTSHTLLVRENTPGLRAVAMDHWLFGLTDFQVISRWSGFGRSGGFRSRRANQMYTLDNAKPTKRDCSNGAYDSIRFLTALGDGVAIGDWHPGV